MSGVRVLVGTRKGAFVLTSDGKRAQMGRQRPHFGGWEIYHVKGSPVDPNRIYASQSSGWFGQVMQRSSDGGKTWEPVGNKFEYDGVPGTHQWYDGTPHPWEFKRVWHLEPSLTDPDTVYAGAEDAALFKSADGGQTWQELSGLRGHGSGSRWPRARAACVCTRFCSIPTNQARMFIAISAAGAFRSRRCRQDMAADQSGAEIPAHPGSDGGRGALRAPDRDAPVPPERAVHAEALGCHAQRRWRRFLAEGQRQPADRLRVRRSTCTRTSRTPIYVVPIKSDSEHYPPDGKLRVYRSRTGGNEWEALGERSAAERLLRQRPA